MFKNILKTLTKLYTLLDYTYYFLKMHKTDECAHLSSSNYTLILSLNTILASVHPCNFIFFLVHVN